MSFHTQFYYKIVAPELSEDYLYMVFDLEHEKEMTQEQYDSIHRKLMPGFVKIMELPSEECLILSNEQEYLENADQEDKITLGPFDMPGRSNKTGE